MQIRFHLPPFAHQAHPQGPPTSLSDTLVPTATNDRYCFIKTPLSAQTITSCIASKNISSSFCFQPADWRLGRLECHMFATAPHGVTESPAFATFVAVAGLQFLMSETRLCGIQARLRASANHWLWRSLVCGMLKKKSDNAHHFGHQQPNSMSMSFSFHRRQMRRADGR